jgi:hypothetical protein
MNPTWQGPRVVADADIRLLAYGYQSDITDNGCTVGEPSPATPPQSKPPGHHTYLTVGQGSDIDCYGELIGSIPGAC